MLKIGGSGQNIVCSFSADVGEAEVASGVAEGEAFVIDTGEMQDGGVEVVHLHRFVFGFEAEVVGRSLVISSAHATASQIERTQIELESRKDKCDCRNEKQIDAPNSDSTPFPKSGGRKPHFFI